MKGKLVRGRRVLVALGILVLAVTAVLVGRTLTRGDRVDAASVLEGKSILFFGDSITSGYGLEDYSLSWCGMLETEYAMDVTCHSVKGSTIGAAEAYGWYAGACFWPMSYRSTPEGDFDVIFLQGGSNDWSYEIPLGADPESRDTYTFMGALNVTIDRLQEAYPEALLLCCTPWNSEGDLSGLGLALEDYSEAVLAVCEKRGIPCFEAWDPSVSGIDAASGAFREEYFLTANDTFHMNPEGQKLYFPVISQWIGRQLSAWEKK